MSDKKIKNNFLSWLEINLDNLSFNFRQIKKLICPKTKILVCVKKDAYGHGLVPVAKKLIKEGIDFFGVASIKEAITLRKSDISTPILILGTSIPEDIEPIIKY
ncbi:MAG: alanine racemase, partial [bacterium]